MFTAHIRMCSAALFWMLWFTCWFSNAIEITFFYFSVFVSFFNLHNWLMVKPQRIFLHFSYAFIFTNGKIYSDWCRPRLTSFLLKVFFSFSNPMPDFDLEIVDPSLNWIVKKWNNIEYWIHILSHWDLSFLSVNTLTGHWY